MSLLLIAFIAILIAQVELMRPSLRSFILVSSFCFSLFWIFVESPSELMTSSGGWVILLSVIAVTHINAVMLDSLIAAGRRRYRSN